MKKRAEVQGGNIGSPLGPKSEELDQAKNPRHGFVATLWYSQEIPEGILTKDEKFLQDNGIRYFIGQYEICPKTGREHLQCYFQSEDRVRYTAWRKVFGGHYFYNSYGGLEKNQEYCTKLKKGGGYGGWFWEWGTAVWQGDTRVWATIIKMVREDGNYERVDADETLRPTLVARKRQIDDYLGWYLGRKVRTENTECIIYFGYPGSGKTHAAWAEYPNAFEFDPNQGAKAWWTGYDNHETVIIDDYDGCSIERVVWNRLFDRRAMKVWVHYGFKQFVAKRIIITTNIPLAEWSWGEGMERRVTCVENFLGPCRYPPKW